jgi:hypothetical protein
MSLLKKFLLGVILVAVLAFTAKEVFYTKKAVATVKQEGSRFYYYPQLNTYYDVTANNFYYTLDGGETWIVKKPASPHAPNTLGQKVVFFSQTAEVWKDNALHIEQYGGSMVNYVKEDSLIREAALRDSSEKPKLAVVETVEKEPEVKGRFLKKLRQKIKNRLKDRDKETEEAPH